MRSTNARNARSTPNAPRRSAATSPISYPAARAPWRSGSRSGSERKRLGNRRTGILGTKFLLIGGCLSLAACNGRDWRAQAITNAEEKVQIEVNYPAAEFSRVQVTGNSTTGQTCGYVTVKTGYAQLKRTARFIVYIDGTAGLLLKRIWGRILFRSKDSILPGN